MPRKKERTTSALPATNHASQAFASTLLNHLDSHFQLLKDSSEFAKRPNPLQRNAILFVDIHYFLDEYGEMFETAKNQGKSLKYLRSKNLLTYGDLLERQKAIFSHLSNSDPACQMSLEYKMIYGGKESEPELQGFSRLFLGVLDFIPAIPWIPHSPNPEHPTILGLMLSSAQAVLRDERFFSSSLILHQDVMHLLVSAGTYLSGYARTTTGQPISESYPVIDDTNARPGNFLFDEFTVTNAIPFHPEYILLAGYPKIMPDANGPKEETRIIYNMLEPGKVMFIPPAGDPSGSTSQMSPSPFTPELMRSFYNIIPCK